MFHFEQVSLPSANPLPVNLCDPVLAVLTFVFAQKELAVAVTCFGRASFLSMTCQTNASFVCVACRKSASPLGVTCQQVAPGLDVFLGYTTHLSSCLAL